MCDYTNAKGCYLIKYVSASKRSGGTLLSAAHSPSTLSQQVQCTCSLWCNLRCQMSIMKQLNRIIWNHNCNMIFEMKHCVPDCPRSFPKESQGLNYGPGKFHSNPFDYGSHKIPFCEFDRYITNWEKMQIYTT